MKKYGIDQLKPTAEQLVIFGLTIEKLRNAKGWINKLSLIFKAIKLKVIINAVKNRELIGNQIKDLDLHEVQELTFYLEEKFDLIPDKLENTIKEGFEFLESLFNFINTLKK